MKQLITLSAAWVIYATISSVADTEAPIKGYQCFGLNTEALHLTPDDVFAGRNFPKIFNAPRVDATPIGDVSSLIYVTWPLKIDNGFVQVLRMNGELGWLTEKAIRAMHRADGSVGGCTLFWSKDRGLISAHLDPGVAIWR